MKDKNLRDFKTLLEIMKYLRGPKGCPWDKKQTAKTLIPYTIEETYELVEAIESKEKEDIISELGDVLLQVVFYCQIARESGEYSINDVIESICKKMINRHPHVFGDVKIDNLEEALKNWEQIKTTEKKAQDELNIPKNLPALMYSQKMGNFSKIFNFDWASIEDVFSHLEDELNELKEAIRSKELKAIRHEVGDCLFSLVQVARHCQFDAETSLRQMNERFKMRFISMQKLAKEKGLDFKNLTSKQSENLWKEVKLKTNNFTSTEKDTF